VRGFAVALLLLCGCATVEVTERDETIDLSGYNFNIGPDGAAGISEALPMDIDVIRAAVGNFEVGGETSPEGAWREFTLWAGDVDPEFRIFSAADGRYVHMILTTSGNFVGPLGERSGTPFHDIPERERMFCVSQEVDNWRGFSCSAQPDGRLWRIFRLAHGEIGPTEPFTAIRPYDLENARLAGMRWFAPPQPD
jgi:hypothetical protein